MKSSDQTTLRNNKDERGAALMMALFFFTIASFIVTQLSSETLTESMLASREMKKLKSKYSAKAGLEMALLRVKAFQQAKSAVSQISGAQGANFDQQLAMIWEFPLPWPIEIPGDAGIIVKDENEEVLEESLISNITFFHEIQDAGTKIDLNSLGSPVESISEKTLESLLRSFEQLLQTDSELSSEHNMDTIKEVLNNVADWIDKDTESRNGGGDESSLYRFEEQIGYPRNSSLITLSELMLVDKMDDIIFKYLSDLITIHGTFGINVNTAERDVLMSIDEQFTEENTAEFLERRATIKAEGLSLDQQRFDSLLSELGFSGIEEIHSQGVPLIYSPLSTFKITSTGTTGNLNTTITAYVIDANTLKEIFIEQLDLSASSSTDKTADPAAATPTTTATPAATTATKVEPPPKGRPYVVHMRVN